MRIVDLSHPLSNETPPFPGDPAVEIKILAQTEQTGPEERQNLNCGLVSLPIHCATHIDAPYHFYADRATIDQVPLSTCTGPAIALDLLDQPVLDAMHLAPFHAQIAAHRHILIHTGWYHQWGQEHYFTDHPVLTAAAAQLPTRALRVKVTATPAASAGITSSDQTRSFLANNAWASAIPMTSISSPE